MEMIKIHSAEKHRKLQELGEKCIRKEKMKKSKKKLNFFIYGKNDVVVSVLNSQPSNIWGGGAIASLKH